MYRIMVNACINVPLDFRTECGIIKIYHRGVEQSGSSLGS